MVVQSETLSEVRKGWPQVNTVVPVVLRGKVGRRSGGGAGGTRTQDPGPRISQEARMSGLTVNGSDVQGATVKQQLLAVSERVRLRTS